MNHDEIREKVDDLQMSLPQWCSDGDYAITIYGEMRSIIDTLLARVEALEAERAWLPITHDDFTDGCYVFALEVVHEDVYGRWSYWDCYCLYYTDEGELKELDGQTHFSTWSFEDFTHYQKLELPLPAPPNTKEIE